MKWFLLYAHCKGVRVILTRLSESNARSMIYLSKLVGGIGAGRDKLIHSKLIVFEDFIYYAGTLGTLRLKISPDRFYVFFHKVFSLQENKDGYIVYADLNKMAIGSILVKHQNNIYNFEFGRLRSDDEDYFLDDYACLEGGFLYIEKQSFDVFVFPYLDKRCHMRNLHPLEVSLKDGMGMIWKEFDKIPDKKKAPLGNFNILLNVENKKVVEAIKNAKLPYDR